MKIKIVIIILMILNVLMMIEIVSVKNERDSFHSKWATEKVQNIALRETLKNQKEKMRSRIVNVSFYCPVLRGINGKPGQSASGQKLRDGWSVAVSRDLVDAGWYGTQIDMYGSNLPIRFRGIKYSSDKMARRNPYTKKEITNQIDIYVSNPGMIPKKGVFENVKVTRIDN